MIDHPPVLVTAVPEICQIQFTDPSGDIVHPAMEFGRRDSAEKLAGRLASMYIEMGQGDFAYNDLRQQPGFRTPAINGALRALEKGAPPGVYTRHDEPGGEVFHFGNFAVASRKPTTEESAAYRMAARLHNDAKMTAAKESALDENAEKTDLTQHDHALIAIGDTSFSLDFDSPDAIMATRVVEALGILQLQLPRKNNIIDQRDVADIVWRSMSINERQLFAKKEADLYRLSHIIQDQVKRVLGSVTSLLGATRRGHLAQNYYHVTDELLKVQIMAVPPELPYSNIRAIFPPGTSRMHLEQVTNSGEIDASTLTRAQLLVARTSRPGRLQFSHDEAIAVLDTIMSRDGKRALRHALGEGQIDRIDSVLAKLQVSARLSLGNVRYYGAYRDRLIAGNVISNRHRRVRQVGGRLEGSTTRSDVRATLKWTIVEPNLNR